jgi:hypothetical protein
MGSNARVERRAALLTLIEAALSKTATSLYPFRSRRPRARSNTLLDATGRTRESSCLGEHLESEPLKVWRRAVA